MSTRYDFDRIPSEPLRLAVCDWLKAHGIDPCDVATPGWIELDDEARRVRWEAYRLDEHGRIPVVDGDAVREVHSMQLESPPLPFPRVPS